MSHTAAIRVRSKTLDIGEKLRPSLGGREELEHFSYVDHQTPEYRYFFRKIGTVSCEMPIPDGLVEFFTDIARFWNIRPVSRRQNHRSKPR